MLSWFYPVKNNVKKTVPDPCQKNVKTKMSDPEEKNGKKTIPPDGKKPLKKLVLFTNMGAPGREKNCKETVALGRKKRKKNGGVF